ncbi:hypothetical protein UXO42_07945 [Enterobacter quasihormaechei]|uniref:hypothetical protein n=1 Tax=Enterobacter quasihormaechei TaxID=2529382 RepID=UPI002FCFBF77
MNLKSKLWYFWGAMDVLAIMLYCMSSLRNGKIPFVTDILTFSGSFGAVSDAGYSVLVTLFFVFDLLLLLSFFVSAWFFFKRKKCAIKFALIQEVFRLISFRCSVSLFPLLVSVFGISNVWINLVLFITSELLKFSSLVFWMNERRKN